ncbi:MAG: methionyl-tRNA formyltransferase [Candidatus Lambdaproteobacteria bacterium]|nr:methionyl-tRNA formyltransferase [Candidatus Lambdaproteobacteria bacterium]
MRIVLIGQQPFGEKVLEAVLGHGEEVVAVFVAPEKPGQRADPLKTAAMARAIPVHQPKSFRKPEVWELIRGLKPEVAMMAYVTQFVPEEVLHIPARGTFQYHPSLLPRHRGPSSINWPIIRGETRTGLSIFWPDNGLDTGPILLQKEVPIGEADTLGSLYFDHLFPMGVAAMIEALQLVKAGKAPRIAQDEAQATYEGWCKPEDVQVDWSRPLRQVHDLIRGADPQPGAWSRHGGKVLQLFECAKQAGAGRETPGTVTAVGAEGVAVAVPGGQLVLKRVRPEGGAKVTAAEWAKAAGVAPGARLGG